MHTPACDVRPVSSSAIAASDMCRSSKSYAHHVQVRAIHIRSPALTGALPDSWSNLTQVICASDELLCDGMRFCGMAWGRTHPSWVQQGPSSFTHGNDAILAAVLPVYHHVSSVVLWRNMDCCAKAR